MNKNTDNTIIDRVAKQDFNVVEAISLASRINDRQIDLNTFKDVDYFTELNGGANHLIRDQDNSGYSIIGLNSERDVLVFAETMKKAKASGGHGVYTCKPEDLLATMKEIKQGVEDGK